jgi:hypothetical protein
MNNITNSEKTNTFSKRLFNKIKKETGLDDFGATWYNVFVTQSCILDGIVKYDDIKEGMRKYVALINYHNPEHNMIADKYVESKFSKYLELFEEKKLIDYQTIEDGHIYPRIIGYNFLNDPEFFVAYRKKGETEWVRRMPMNSDISDIIKHAEQDYEFRDVDIKGTLFN